MVHSKVPQAIHPRPGRGVTLALTKVSNSTAIDLHSSTRVKADLSEIPFSVVRQVVDPTPLLGKRIRFSAYVRTADRDAEAQAMLWMRVDRKSGKRGGFDNMQGPPYHLR